MLWALAKINKNCYESFLSYATKLQVMMIALNVNSVMDKGQFQYMKYQFHAATKDFLHFKLFEH